MLIDRAERVYAKWTPTPNLPLEVSFDGRTTWIAGAPGLEDADGNWSADPAGGVYAILVAGPDAVGNPVDTVVLQLGTTKTIARIVDSPEVFIEVTGEIGVG